MRSKYFKKGSGIGKLKFSENDLKDPDANIVNEHNEKVLSRELKTLIKLNKKNIISNSNKSGLKKKPIDTSILHNVSKKC